MHVMGRCTSRRTRLSSALTGLAVVPGRTHVASEATFNCRRAGLTRVPVRRPAMRSPLAMRRPSPAVTAEGSVPPPRSLVRPDHGPEARALLAFPWETTPIGPVDSWPDQLRLLVQVMLSSE